MERSKFDLQERFFKWIYLYLSKHLTKDPESAFINHVFERLIQLINVSRVTSSAAFPYFCHQKLQMEWRKKTWCDDLES